MLCHSGLILHWLIIHVLDTLLGNRQTLILAKENALALHIMFSRSHTQGHHQSKNGDIRYATTAVSDFFTMAKKNPEGRKEKGSNLVTRPSSFNNGTC